MAGAIVVSLIIWGIALVGLCSRRDIDVHSKISWLVVILVLNIVGAIIYFIFSPEVKKVEQTKVILKDDTSHPSTCMICTNEIFPGEDTCRVCGWTYKSN
jgi:predicted membrane channel-forming protein YqfA (hemolysin III family)